MVSAPPPAQRRLAQLGRHRFVDGLCAGLPALDKAVHEFLSTLMNQTGTQREMQRRRDAWMDYQKHRKAWVEQVGRAWREALQPQPISSAVPLDGGPFPFLFIESNVTVWLGSFFLFSRRSVFAAIV